MHTGNGTDPDTVGPDATPMVKDGYGADNAKLLVDHFEVFATESVAAHKSFVALIWFQNVHVQCVTRSCWSGAGEEGGAWRSRARAFSLSTCSGGWVMTSNPCWLPPPLIISLCPPISARGSVMPRWLPPSPPHSLAVSAAYRYTATEEFTSLYPVGPTITQAQQDFWGSLSAMDAQVGRCRRILTDLAVAEDTFVLFTSDNVRRPWHLDIAGGDGGGSGLLCPFAAHMRATPGLRTNLIPFAEGFGCLMP